tara:strand:- start:2482 stop:2808 length:327 start_codon:yes stop_codon:yes gene_type:complete
MLIILAELQVRDFEAFERFESLAIKVMAKYGGELISAFETQRQANTGVEIHLLSFPSTEAFEQYRADGELAALRNLREIAIEGTTLTFSETPKEYRSESKGARSKGSE